MDAATFPDDPPTLIRPHLSQPFCTTRPVATPLFLCFLAHSVYRARVLGINSTRARRSQRRLAHQGLWQYGVAPKFEDDGPRLILDVHIQQPFTLCTLSLFYSTSFRSFPTTTPGARGTHDSVYRG